MRPHCGNELEAAVGIKFLSAASVVVRRMRRAKSAARRGATGGIVGGCCFSFLLVFQIEGCTAEVATRIRGVGEALGKDLRGGPYCNGGEVKERKKWGV